MNKRIVAFVHGWSVTHTDTYGGLPEALQQQAAAHGLQIEIKDLHLGRYISFHDEVGIDDLARAMQHAVQQDLGHPAEFSCITHSTGGPLVRRWVDRYYAPRNLADCPLRHLVMLAPANHGSKYYILATTCRVSQNPFKLGVRAHRVRMSLDGKDPVALPSSQARRSPRVYWRRSSASVHHLYGRSHLANLDRSGMRPKRPRKPVVVNLPG